MKNNVPLYEWRITCLEPQCGAVFVASTQEPVCRVCRSTKLSKQPIARKVSGGCVPKREPIGKNPFVEPIDLDDD